MDSCEVSECGPVLTFRHEYWDQVFRFIFLVNCGPLCQEMILLPLLILCNA